MSPVPAKAALIVAHGQPSAPEGPEEVMRTLAASVAARLGAGWRVGGATLAAPGAVAAALAEMPDSAALMVYPHFMADGWFSTDELPRRLREAGAGAFAILPAFGLNPQVHRLCLRRASEGAAAAGHAPGAAALLLAAHGHPSDPRAAQAARAAARFLAASGAFRDVVCGFIDEAPYIAEAARLEPPALCLPFFAGRAGHVESDLPAALAEAGFPGPVLAPIGADPEVPAIIAAALAKAAAHQAA